MTQGSSAAPAIMVLGCTSGAGKSWIVTALCRWYAAQGLRVAPFKAQNMSNHARVARMPQGNFGEIGSAQYFQALAANVVPDVRMNPVLLKPETDTRSQVVLCGQVNHELGRQPWRERSATLWDAARAALDSLRADFDLVLIEGAGSPAEINLADTDFVNTKTALASGAACLLASDIDRGGSFAHLYGTYQLMDARVRQQLQGFILNRFRGDAALLSPGPERLQELTGVPTVAVIPLLHEHGLPEEDAVPANTSGGGPNIVVLCPPHVSNLDEFEPLRSAGIRISFARDVASIGHADWLILPGSKQARADLAWLRERRLDAAILAHVARGRPLLAVCGGLQMAGERLEDPAGVEASAAGDDAGLGLLPLITRYEKHKRLVRARARLHSTDGAWAALAGLPSDGYEIHVGNTHANGDCRTVMWNAEGTPIGWQRGSVLGLYLHGLFENPLIVRALFGVSPPDLEQTFSRMSDLMERCFGRHRLMQLCGR